MTVGYSADGSVGYVLLDRVERRNAINYSALDEIAEAVALARRDDLRALVISGVGGHFCSGADLSELEDQAFTKTLRVVLDSIAGLSFPTIAAISGACMGLGMQLAMACDLRVGHPDARFAVPVSKLGLMVDFWTVQRLALLAGHSTARHMLLTAAPISAQRAHQVGFLHSLVEASENPLDVATEMAETICTLAPLSISGSKLGLDLLEQSAEVADPESLYQDAFDRAWSSSDLREGQLAFSERRPPRFEGR